MKDMITRLLYLFRLSVIDQNGSSPPSLDQISGTQIADNQKRAINSIVLKSGVGSNQYQSTLLVEGNADCLGVYDANDLLSGSYFL